MDEVGSNTSATKDGNIGGEKFLCERFARPQINAATKDAHFKVLGFTAATGDPVMCAVIVSANKLRQEWVLGCNGSASWIGDADGADANAGNVNMQFPMRRVSKFNGIDIPTFCFCSNNGRITADLLVSMLETINKLKVIDRSDGLPPFLLLDDHGSRFYLKFLEYINQEETEWKVSHGVPYGTSYWQVGDSIGKNGCFKMTQTQQYKRELLKQKESVGGEFTIEKEDVKHRVAQAWADAFACKTNNQNAIAERGWMSLIHDCLLHVEILGTRGRVARSGRISEVWIGQVLVVGQYKGGRQSEVPSAEEVIAAKLRSSQGLSGNYMDSITETRIRDDAQNSVNLQENRQKQKQTALDVIYSKSKQYTAGIFVVLCIMHSVHIWWHTNLPVVRCDNTTTYLHVKYTMRVLSFSHTKSSRFEDVGWTERTKLE